MQLLLWGKSQNLGLFSLEKGQDTVYFWWWSLTKLRGNGQYWTEDSFGTSGNPILLWEWLTYCHRLPREIICFPFWAWFWATSIRYLWLSRRNLRGPIQTQALLVFGISGSFSCKFLFLLGYSLIGGIPNFKLLFMFCIKIYIDIYK